MDLLSTIRKTGSRGGVNFSWDDVANSSHRQNYLGHSLKAPVGRWAKGRDLDWYAKADSKPADSAAETDEERRERERKEELRKIKEAEEDAIARALGLPVKVRDTTGANAIEVEPKRQIGPASGPPEKEAGEESRREKSRRHGDHDRRERRRHRSRSRSRSRDRDGDRDRSHRHRRDGERIRDRSRDRNDRENRRHRRDRDRSRSAERKDRRRRDRSKDTGKDRYRSRSREHRRRSPDGGSRR